MRPLTHIEGLLLEAFRRVGPDRGIDFCDLARWVLEGNPIEYRARRLFDTGTGMRISDKEYAGRPQGWGVYGQPIVAAIPQLLIAGYRVDFFVYRSGRAALAVECDGHTWHERTPHQASRDRSRDRQLLALGVPTVRFTGSDIVRDPDACAGEVLDVLDAFGDHWARADDVAHQLVMARVGAPEG